MCRGRDTRTPTPGSVYLLSTMKVHVFTNKTMKSPFLLTPLQYLISFLFLTMCTAVYWNFLFISILCISVSLIAAFHFIHLRVASITESSWEFYAYSYSVGSSGNGKGRAFDTRNDRERKRGGGGGGTGPSGSGKDKIDALGRLL